MEYLITQAAQWREHLALLVHVVPAYVALRCFLAGRGTRGAGRRRLVGCGLGAAALVPVAAAPSLGVVPAIMVMAMAILAAGKSGARGWRTAICDGAGVAMLASALAFLALGKVPMLGTGPSMWPTTGKHLSVFWMEPGHRSLMRGDRIDFHVPLDEENRAGGWPAGRYHKRIIGVGGDHVAVSDYAIFVNGKPVADCHPRGGMPRLSATTWLCKGAIEREDGTVVHYRMTWGVPGIWMEGPQEWRLPPGSLLVMGDNLVASADSRQRGAIDLGWVVGRVVP